MAKWSELKRQHQLLHRFLCGLTVSCVVVTIIGSAMAGLSSFELTLRALMVAVGLMVLQQVIVRFWASWEFVQSANRRTVPRRR